MSVLAIPSALDLLRAQLQIGVDAEDLALPLRALQLRGLTKLELVVHVERMRAANDASNADEQLEENCLVALDIIHGSLPGLGLRWDSAQLAASLLPRCITESDILAAIPYALRPSDLLPPRGGPTEAHSTVGETLGRATFAAAMSYELPPARCDLYRVPKSPFTSRPAALLTLPDRLVLEALSGFVESKLSDALPDAVVWPRNRAQAPAHNLATARVLEWTAPYVVKADISSFYEAVEHSLLAVFLASHLELPVPRARALESMLTSVMGLQRGLPQGPPSSDVLASAYLLALDRRLAADDATFVRYADDYFFPADSMGEGRLLLQALEELLRDIGLSLNASKTQIMRRETFERGLRRPSPAVAELREKLAEQEVEGLYEMEDSEELAEILTRAGVEEQTLWDLLYHGTTTLDEVLSDISDDFGPSLSNTYAMYFRQIASALTAENRSGDLAPLESLARECLAFLTASDVDVDSEDLRTVQTWFPGLSPLVARYLISRRDQTEWVSSFLQRHLEDLSNVDWVDAWMCHAAGQTRAAAEASVVEELVRILSTDDAGQLTKAESLRALASAGALTEEDWTSFFHRASPAIRSEMFFAALDDLDRYSWLAAHLRQARDPALTVVAAELEAGIPGSEQ